MGDANIQTSEDLLKELGLDPNHDGAFNEDETPHQEI